MRRALVISALAGLAASLANLAPAQNRTTAPPPPSMTPVQLLNRPIPPNAPNAAQLQRGRDLVIQGDCVSCHTRSGGEPMAGGLAMATPFGVIYSPNLTPDTSTGIGDWTADQFYRAMHEGVDDQGHQLYPAFPYVYFSHISRADTDAILAYLKTAPSVRYSPPPNRLPFPFNIRFLIKAWNLLFFHPEPFRPAPSQPPLVNQGARIVNSLGHCAQCHTPVNLLGANDAGRAFRGGSLENWVAPNLTGDARTGLGSWNAADIVEYLKFGRNARAQAGGPMAEVVSFSTGLMSDEELNAIAAYLKSLPASPTPESRPPDPQMMARGAAIYSDACASCHLEDGIGQPRYFPPLGRDAVAQQRNPTGLLHLILAGVRTAPTQARPSSMSMPSFAWKLSDQQIADVSTYLRNSFGNRADPVSPADVSRLRRRLGLTHEILTQNSGDRYAAGEPPAGAR